MIELDLSEIAEFAHVIVSVLTLAIVAILLGRETT